MMGTSSDGGMAKVERTHLLSLLKSSETSFVSSIAGLTQEQWAFKPSPDAWSIQECAEHLILTEDLIFEESQKVLKTPIVARLPNATIEGDRQVVEQMEDRSKKARVPKSSSQQTSSPRPKVLPRNFKSVGIRRSHT
jgi:hypothetical protein